MPTYEYNCKKCNKHFEASQKITHKPQARCPECGGDAKRLISASNFSLKGSGWYKDGYSSSGKGAGSNPACGSCKNDTCKAKK